MTTKSHIYARLFVYMDTVQLEKEIDELLTRGVGEFIDPEDSFKKKLIEKSKGIYTKPIVIKFGVDPTRPDLHLGHAVVLRKLRKFQELGCKVVFLIGDFTSQIGDPTGKSKVRPELADTEIRANMKTYLEQVEKILITTDKEVFSWIGNADWFTAITDLISEPRTIKITDSKDPQKFINIDANSFIGKAVLFENTRMQINDLKLRKNIQVITLRTFISTLRNITHSQLIERDMFQDRLNTGTELYMHEMMYPILQGIDSVVIHEIYNGCDLEVGGTDQHFNMLMGRTIMRISKQSEQAVLSFKLLEGLDGKEKMSKSLNNYIGVTDEPNDMYGKV
ncbi:tyrosine--tRNA ligase, partial [Patescibacteria group bacterium]|nr:tyrosine--tRNA ligase [Patescibacteria group bacterium]